MSSTLLPARLSLVYHEILISPTNLRRTLLVLCLLLAFLSPACDRTRGRSHEIAYVSAPQAFLRDRVAAIYNKTGTVKNGDRVEVLERDRRFARVHTDSGAEGWLEQRYLVTQQVYDAFQKLVQEAQSLPVQATAVTRNDTNLHLEPGRDTEHLYQLDRDAKISVFKRAIAAKGSAPAAPVRALSDKQKTAQPAAPPMEDWWLVRDASGHVGWVLGRMLDIDLPLEIAQYAEGQRIIAAFELQDVPDGEKKVPEYLTLMTEPKDGMPYDYNQVRVFTWNVRKHRYETAYRERNLNGVLPVKISRETFDKEGMLPVFTLHVTDDTGKTIERKYKLNTPIVRRVLPPGEQPPKAAVSSKPARKRVSRRRRH